MFGLSAQWLLYDGAPVADALVFAHTEQVQRLARQVPAAADVAVLAGDPCFDRMLASRGRRSRFRAALGVDDTHRLVVVSSSWSTHSLLGSWPDLLRRLLAELPVDSYRVALVAHPNIRGAHGDFQLRSWLSDCLRAGLAVVPALTGWQAALVAADLVIGDFGSVTCYGAALGTPTLLAGFADDQVAPGTAVHRLGALAPRLSRRVALRPQLDAAVDGHAPDRYADVADLVTSVPGESPRRLRALFYRLLRLPEPDAEAALPPFDTAGLTQTPPARAAALVVACEVDDTRRLVRLERYPADSWPYPSAQTRSGARTHLFVHHEHPLRRLRQSADVLFADEADIGGGVEAWLADTFDRHPSCRRVAVAGPDGCLLAGRDGTRINLSAAVPDPLALASAAYAWHTDGRPPTASSARLTVEIGGRRYPVSTAARRPPG